MGVAIRAARAAVEQPTYYRVGRPFLDVSTDFSEEPAVTNSMFQRWIEALRALKSPLVPIVIAIVFYLAVNLSCWIVVRHLLASFKSTAHQLAPTQVDAETGETDLQRYLAQFKAELYPNLRDIQAERIERQYIELVQRQTFHIQVAELLYVNYLTGLVFAPFASALAAFCLFAIGRQGWAQTDNLTIDTFKVAFASTVLTSAFMLIFKYDDNVALQLELFSEYEKLQGSMQSYLATGRLYVRSNLLLTPLLANSQTGQAMQASRPEVEARPIDEVEADEASSQIAPDATAVAWIYKLATFIEYVDNELSRLRSETIFHLDPSAVPTTQDILNQLESFGDSPVVVPSNDPERAPVVEPVAPAP